MELKYPLNIIQHWCSSIC